MDLNWTKADLKNLGKLHGAQSQFMQLANEALARELSLSLSAFLRSSLRAVYANTTEGLFGDLSLSARASCFGLALLGSEQGKLLIELEHSAIFPLLGFALGAKPGNFALPDRKPTEIELQVVHLLLRRIVPEACRAWSALVPSPLETVSLEIEQTPDRVLPATEPVLIAEFQLTAEQPLGLLRLLAPLNLFARSDAQPGASRVEPAQSGVSVENTLELMLPVRVSVDVWLDASQMLLRDLIQLREGQIVKLDHPVDRKVSCTLNGKPGFSGQIVSTGAHRAFLVEELGA
jgi:flagellar motor switch protein FliM